jgi:ATP-binding cassette subfamily B protein
MLQVVRPLEMLGVAMRDLSQAVAFIHPLLDVLRVPMEVPARALPGPEQAPERCAPGTAAAPPPATRTIGSRQGAPRIRFQGVHFGYDANRPVLKDFELDIEAGAMVAIVGASGSGKSSIARLLLRFYDPVAGQILLDQLPVDALAIGELRGMIGLVPQDVALFNDTIAANIGIAVSGAQRRDIEHAARVAHLHDFISQLPAGYDTLVGERGLKISGGERQRIAIARAILRRPRIYVLDEATSMLDSRTEAAVLRSVREAAAGCTTLTIAHRLSTARHADEIVVLENGRITERGRHASLIANGGAYARLWHAQLRGDTT